MLNKRGQDRLITFLLLGVGAYFLFTSGILGGNDSSDTSGLFPSDLKTTVTLNTGDKLATTATNANVSYYVFKENGGYLKEGTTSAGTDDFTVPTNGKYKLWVYDDTSATATPDYLPILVEFSTDGNNLEDRAVTTVNVDLNKESNATVENILDPTDLNANSTFSAGSSLAFDVLMSAETSKAVVSKPVVRIMAVTNCTDKFSFPTLTEQACPQRLSSAVQQGYSQYCFASDTDLSSVDGIVKVSGSWLTQATGDCNTDNPDVNLTVQILDTGIYRESDYKTKGIDAFKFGTENPVDDSNIGAGDSNFDWLFIN